jgi:hypothetical protein
MAFRETEASKEGLAHLRGSRVKETKYEQIHVGPQTEQSQTKQNMGKSFLPINMEADAVAKAEEAVAKADAVAKAEEKAKAHQTLGARDPVGRTLHVLSRASRRGRGRASRRGRGRASRRGRGRASRRGRGRR